MAKTPAQKHESAESAGAAKGSPLLTFLMVLTSTFTLALVAMLFATGAAQRSALPRVRELIANAPLVGKRAEPEPAAQAAPAETLATALPHWSAAADSIAILEEQLATALTEIAASRAPVAGPDAAIGALGPAAQAAAFSPAAEDSGAQRDLARLVKVLDAMKPADAARILDAAPDELAIEAIRRLKERQAGKVLASLAPAKAMTVGHALGRAAERPE
jgi:flagellar motility protein MotE (MotC chaperone)